MVNILKHRKINKNPFVKYLKDFSKYDKKAIKELSETKGTLEHFLGNGRSIIIENGFLYLVNYEYYSLGCFKIPIENFQYENGNIYFITEDSDLKADLETFYTSEKELYKLISEMDSFKEHDLKEVLLIIQEIGFKRNLIDLG